MSSSVTFWKFAAGAGVLMVYGIYFLWKRRSDSLSKQRRKNKNLLQKKKQPIFHKNPETEDLIIREIQLGSEFLAKGDTINGVHHLSNALAHTSDPYELMDVFQFTISPDVYQLLPYQKPAEDKFMEESIWKTAKIQSSTIVFHLNEAALNDETMSRDKFLMQELELGEEFLAKGDLSNGVKHISNVLAKCFQPQKLLQALQKKMSPENYQLLTSTERTLDS